MNLHDAVKDLELEMSEFEEQQTAERLRRLKAAVRRVSDCADEVGDYDLGDYS